MLIRSVTASISLKTLTPLYSHGGSHANLPHHGIWAVAAQTNEQVPAHVVATANAWLHCCRMTWRHSDSHAVYITRDENMHSRVCFSSVGSTTGNEQIRRLEAADALCGIRMQCMRSSCCIESQHHCYDPVQRASQAPPLKGQRGQLPQGPQQGPQQAVSYTHRTLPKKRGV